MRSVNIQSTKSVLSRNPEIAAEVGDWADVIRPVESRISAEEYQRRRRGNNGMNIGPKVPVGSVPPEDKQRSPWGAINRPIERCYSSKLPGRDAAFG